MTGDRGSRLRPGHLGWAHVLIGAAAAIACAMVLPSLVLMAATASGGPSSPQAPPWLAVAQFALLAVVVVSVLRRARRKAEKRAVATTGSPGEGAFAVRSLAFAGLAAVAFAVAANLLLDAPGIESPHAIVNQLGLGIAAWSDALIIAGVAVAAPIGEELALRGLVFRGAYDALGRKRGGASMVGPFAIAAVLSAAVFAVLHVNPAFGQNVFFVCLGLGAAAAYWLTGALASAVWVHSLVNAIGLAFALFVATGVGSVWHAVALVAAPPVALALMVPLSRAAGVVKQPGS